MTTSELIQQLQEADPEGNCHVRVNGECPVFVEKKAGYWDGPYSYIENGEYHISSENEKVDVVTTNLEWWLLDNNIDSVKTHLYPAAQERHEKDFAKLLLTMDD